MSGLPQSQETCGPVLGGSPCSAILRLKELTGIKAANCWSCSMAQADRDGEPGATYHCGIVCLKSASENTYIEEDGIDPDTEKACWEPEYWESESDSPASMHADAVAPIDGSTESMIRNLKVWQSVVYPDSPNINMSDREAAPTKKENDNEN
jgi:hypothetical protein